MSCKFLLAREKNFLSEGKNFQVFLKFGNAAVIYGLICTIPIIQPYTVYDVKAWIGTWL